jgi:hypothetical protein
MDQNKLLNITIEILGNSLRSEGMNEIYFACRSDNRAKKATNTTKTKPKITIQNRHINPIRLLFFYPPLMNYTKILLFSSFLSSLSYPPR